MSDKFLDYWYEYDRFIPFPNEPSTVRKISNYNFLTTVTDEKSNDTNLISFFINYEGTDPATLAGFNKLLMNYRQSNYGLSRIKIFENKQFILFRSYNTSKNKMKNCYYIDVLSFISYSFGDNTNWTRQYLKSNEFEVFKSIMKKEAKAYKITRNENFKQKFGKPLEDFVKEQEKEREEYKNITYTMLVGEAYSKIMEVKESSEIILKGLQDGRNNYTHTDYKRFKNAMASFNIWLGYKNESIKTQIKNGTIKRQTVLMYLRDNAKKIKK